MMIKNFNTFDNNLNKYKMQFLLLGHDGSDADALNRRMNAREDHLKKIDQLRQSGIFLFGGAILSDSGQMIGSMVVYEVPDRESLDEVLKDEPYILGKVWERVEIKPLRLAK
jgi:uncharacterized protein